MWKWRLHSWQWCWLEPFPAGHTLGMLLLVEVEASQLVVVLASAIPSWSHSWDAPSCGRAGGAGLQGRLWS